MRDHILHRLSSLIVFTTWLALTACVARYPMGLSRDQWEALPADRQAEYQAKQYEIDAAKRARAEEDARRAMEQRAEQARLEKERIQQAYANAKYGDIVTVTVQGGSLLYAGKRYPYEPVGFDILKGETKRVPFRGRGLQTIATEFEVRLSDDGNTLYFDSGYRDRIVLVNHQWDRGETYGGPGMVNDVNVGLSGMTFHVRCKALAGAEPARIIIEKR